MELNAFMYRSSNEGGQCKVLAARWQLENTQGYHKNLGKLIWRHVETDGFQHYLVELLGPELVKKFWHGEKLISKKDLQRHLVTYVQWHSVCSRPVHDDLRRYAIDHGLPDKVTTDDDESGNESDRPVDDTRVMVGLAFSRQYMDDNREWNNAIWERRDEIEGCLRQLLINARYFLAASPLAFMEFARLIFSVSIRCQALKLKCCCHGQKNGNAIQIAKDRIQLGTGRC